jgi:hypothetical protein
MYIFGQDSITPIQSTSYSGLSLRPQPSRLSNALDLDVSSTELRKLQTNEHRYPANEFRGRFRRPEREKEGEQKTVQT